MIALIRIQSMRAYKSVIITINIQSTYKSSIITINIHISIVSAYYYLFAYSFVFYVLKMMIESEGKSVKKCVRK